MTVEEEDEHSHYNVYKTMSSWVNQINEQNKHIDIITIENDKYYCDSIELDLNDPEAVGKIVIRTLAKEVLGK